MKITAKTRMHSDKLRNVFAGPRAVREFLDPDCAPPVPLVEIPLRLNPFASDGVRIFAKLMNFLPLGNVKSLPAYNMLLEEERTGKLSDTKTLIENSSGNTVFSLAVIGRVFGIPKTKAIVSHEVSWGKLQLLRFFGTEILVNEEPICPDPSDTTSGIYQAKQIGKNTGWFNPGQYDNAANPLAHEKWTGPQIWGQTRGAISVFCAGLGTTGTILGTSRYLKSMSEKVVSVGVTRKPNNPIPGVRTSSLLREIAFDWKGSVDHVREIGTTESFEKSLELSRAGIMAGPSSGFAFAGLLEYFADVKNSGGLDALRNEDGEIVAVFICPDSPLPYLEEYFEYIPEDRFPKIENQEILIHAPHSPKRAVGVPHAAPEISVPKTYELAYSLSSAKLWEIVERGKKVPVNKSIILVDVRRDDEYAHFHLPGSIHIELGKLVRHLAKLKKESRGRKVIFICKTGNRSGTATALARSQGIEAFSLVGGVTEWSRLDLPRVRPNICIIDHT